MSRVDPILALIDNALRGDTSPDAMRWTPEDDGETLTVLAGYPTADHYFGPGAITSVLRFHVRQTGCYFVNSGAEEIPIPAESVDLDAWIDENTLTRDELWALLDPGPASP